VRLLAVEACVSISSLLQTEDVEQESWKEEPNLIDILKEFEQKLNKTIA
jgi:hypothetical protein